MDRREFALAALAGAQRNPLSPVQMQKLLFILDRNIGNRVGGSGFNFQPYHYGPFDKSVYTVLGALEREGLAAVSGGPNSSRKDYALTDAGQLAGEAILAGLDAPLRDYFRQICDFVRTQSFTGLVSAVYKAYPEMKVNSVFRQ